MTAELPRWANDIDELFEYVHTAHGLAVNMPREGATGRSVHVGIIDSARRLPPSVARGFEVRGGDDHSFVETDEEETRPHCSQVFNLLAGYCPEATFSLYQAVTEDETLPLGGYSDAITAAIDDGVDILNVSAGDPWPGPVRANPNVQETRRALDEGITVVAAAGNWQSKQEQRPPVHCPAALEGVIAVGGFVSRCPADAGEERPDRKTGPYYVHTNPEFEYDDSVPGGTFCGQVGCIGGDSCLTNKSDVPWEYNAQPTGGKPDVLAPVHVPIETAEGKRSLAPGPSFAAPIVTGSLARILDELNRTDRQPTTPYRLREAVVAGAAPLDEGKQSKYDAMGVRRELGLLS